MGQWPMSHPLHLRRGDPTAGSDPVRVDPVGAGWSFAGLEIIELPPQGARVVATGSTEMAVLPLAGSATVLCDDLMFRLQGRPDVFSAVSDFVYLPTGAVATITSEHGGRFALPNAEATRRLAPAHVPAHQVPIEVRGTGRSTRQLNNFLAPEAFAADRLMAVEVLTPAGNWSSYPPHKHDEDRPGEAVLEEIYYFETARCPTTAAGWPKLVGAGFGLQRLYTDDGSIDLTEQVAHGDVVLVPRSYHGPSAAPPGYDLYYLNVLAGPGTTRRMSFHDDPDYHWVRDAWAAEPPDSRVPMTGPEGPVIR
jgi:5-deoxy-glucuronate isomerase